MKKFWITLGIVLLAEGIYHFRMSGRGGRDLWEDIYVDPNSRMVKVNVSTY